MDAADNADLDLLHFLRVLGFNDLLQQVFIYHQVSRIVPVRLRHALLVESGHVLAQGVPQELPASARGFTDS